MRSVLFIDYNKSFYTLSLVNHFPASFCPENVSAYYICGIFCNIFTVESNTMNPDQTAKGAVLSGFILFAIFAINVSDQMREQMTFVLNDGGKG